MGISQHLNKSLGMSKESMAKAMKHPNKLGAGADKRKALPNKEKIPIVMKEFARGTLNSGSGHKVTSKAQALAIGYSEAGEGKAKPKPKHTKTKTGKHRG